MLQLLALFLCLVIAIADARGVQDESSTDRFIWNESKNVMIVGGDVVTPAGKYPHHATLQDPLLPPMVGLFCGASLISLNWMVTACHCVYGITKPETVQICVGEHDLNIKSGNEQTFLAKTIVCHENYSSADNSNDIAVIKVDGTFREAEYVKPITLPAQSTIEDITGDVCVTIGFGATMSGSPLLSYNLREVSVPFVPDTACQTMYAKQNRTIRSSMLCAGSKGKDSCQGDSGGSIFCKQGNKTLSGVTSWGIGCGDELFPGVYTQVSYFREWIFRQTGI